MSDPHFDNINTTSPYGFVISTETTAKGYLRVKTKIWFAHLMTETGIGQCTKLYENTLKKYREMGFKIEGDDN
jgi:hypothetical protein